MYDLKDYPFDIRDVIQLLNLEVKHKNPTSWDLNCPFCGNKKGKMNVSTTKNVFRCNYCGESGGMLALYGNLYNLTSREAYDEIVKSLHLDLEVPDYPAYERKKESEPEFKNSDRANEREIHRTYTRLLEYLNLSEHHRIALTERGLTKEQIDRHRYRSTPLFSFKQLTMRLINEGYTVKGVPGFYELKEGGWSMNMSVKNYGFFIPVISIGGLIQGMQIRLDKPYEGMKYIWFSSVNKPGGVTSRSPVHFIGNPHDPVVYLTEGALKGNIAHELTKSSMLCVAGVNQYKYLPDLLMRLKENGVRQIFEAFDMDKLLRPVCRGDYSKECQYCKERRTNGECYKKQRKIKNIQSGCMHVYQICKDIDLPCIRLVWDEDPQGFWRENLKGIDDYFLEQKESMS